MALDFDVVFIHRCWSSLCIEAPAFALAFSRSLVVAILRFAVEFDHNFMLGQPLIFLYQFCDALRLQCLKDRWSLQASWKNRPFCTVIRLQTSEIPSAKLFEVDSSIFVKIEIFKSTLKLIFVKLMAETKTECCKFLLIYVTVSIDIELFEAVHNLICLFFFIEVFHGADTTEELLCILIIVQRKESWQLINELLVELSLQVFDGLQQFLGLFLVRF